MFPRCNCVTSGATQATGSAGPSDIASQIFRLENLSKTLVTLSRLGGRPLATLVVWKGRVRSLVGRERAVAGLVRSGEVGELGRGAPDCFELFKTVGGDRE